MATVIVKRITGGDKVRGGCLCQFTRCDDRNALLDMWLKEAHMLACARKRGGDDRMIRNMLDNCARLMLAYFIHRVSCQTCGILAQARWDKGGNNGASQS